MRNTHQNNVLAMNRLPSAVDAARRRKTKVRHWRDWKKNYKRVKKYTLAVCLAYLWLAAPRAISKQLALMNSCQCVFAIICLVTLL